MQGSLPKIIQVLESLKPAATSGGQGFEIQGNDWRTSFGFWVC
jgi:hypothetical protein